MKKRVFLCVMTIALLLSFAVSAFAATGYMLTGATANYKKKYNIDTTSGTQVTVKIQVTCGVFASSVPPGGSSKATKVKFVVLDGSGTFVNDPAFSTTEYSLPTESEMITATMTMTPKTDGYVTVAAQLYDDSGKVSPDDNTSAYNFTTTDATIEFTTKDGDDEYDPKFSTDGPYEDATHVTTSAVDDTAGDVESANWDGLDPYFGTENLGNNSAKPKIATSRPTFTGEGYTATSKAITSGKPTEFKIEIKGPSPYVNVYIAAKDAKKLWPLSCDKKFTKQAQDWSSDIQLTKENIKKWKIPFRVTSFDIKSADAASQDKNTTHTVTIAYNGAKVAFKGFPITVSATNDKTKNNQGVQKPVTKTYKIDIVSSKQVPQWVTAGGTVGEDLKKKNSIELSVALASGGSLESVIYTASADGPYYITSKGDKIGMSADVIQPVYNRHGEITTPGYVKIHGTFDKGTKGTKDGTKEVKVGFTLDAVGLVKKTSFKPTVIGKVSPYFEAKNKVSGDAYYVGMSNADGEYDGFLKVKSAEAGKLPSVKFAAKGSKTIKYTLTYGDGEERTLDQFGMSFDSAKGQIIQLTDSSRKKIPTTITSQDDTYAPVHVVVKADNETGTTQSIEALVGVTGPKAKVFLGTDDKSKEIKVLSIPQNAEPGDLFTIGATIGTTKSMVASTDKSANVHFRLADAKTKKNSKEDTEIGEDTYALEQLGLSFIPSEEADQNEYRNLGVIQVGPDGLTATKGTKINLIVSNFGNEQKGNVTIAIVDAKPVIIDAETEDDSSDVILSTTKQTVNLVLSEGAPTNSAKITWKIADKLSGNDKSKITVKLSNPKKEDNKTTDYTKATVEITAKPGITSAATDFLTITAQNAESKLISEKFTIRVHSGDKYVEAKAAEEAEAEKENTQSAPKTQSVNGDKRNVSAAPDAELEAEEAETETETEEESEAEENALVIGDTRTVESLTAEQNAFLADKGYKVVAVLPEVTAKEDDQYEFEVELDEDAPEGATLIWLPFPKNDKEAEDDRIADFYDEEGTAIKEVPAGKVIVVAPWLRENVTYQPVIAVED